jgi:hypothetical protein
MTNLLEQSKNKSDRMFAVSIDGTTRSMFETIYAKIKENGELKLLWEIQRSLNPNVRKHYIKKVTIISEWDRKEKCNRYTDDSSFEKAILKIQKEISKQSN